MRRLFGLLVVGFAMLSGQIARGDDDQILQKILQKLTANQEAGALEGADVDLEVTDGVVSVKGEVKSAEDQALVLDVVRHVRGVKKIVDGLAIDRPVAADRSDATDDADSDVNENATEVPIESLPPKRSATAARTPHSPKLVETVAKEPNRLNSTTLSPVPADEEMRTAVPLSRPVQKAARPIPSPAETAAASETPAMKKYATLPNRSASTKKITYGDSESNASTGSAQPNLPVDDRITMQLTKLLLQEKSSGALRSFQVKAACKNGDLWLTGRVATQEQHKLVINIARRIQGVKQVVDDLKITGTERMAAIERSGELRPENE